MTNRRSTTLKTEDNQVIVIREPQTSTTQNAINIVFRKVNDPDDYYGVILSAEDAREFAITLRKIADRLIADLPATEAE